MDVESKLPIDMNVLNLVEEMQIKLKSEIFWSPSHCQT